jgi:hypothetical protein
MYQGFDGKARLEYSHMRDNRCYVANCITYIHINYATTIILYLMWCNTWQALLSGQYCNSKEEAEYNEQNAKQLAGCIWMYMYMVSIQSQQT